MEKEVDIVALGELLIDFTEAGYGKDGMKLFEQNPGGAPANLLTVASHMGYRTSFIGKVGKDMHGAFLKRTLQNEGIAVDHLIGDDKYFTTLAFVEIDTTNSGIGGAITTARLNIQPDAIIAWAFLLVAGCFITQKLVCLLLSRRGGAPC